MDEEVSVCFSSDKRLISRTYKELQKLTTKRIIQLINGQMSREFLKRVQIANKYIKTA
jgi:hypothetical protein